MPPESKLIPAARPLIVVMGVAGCGKSTVGAALAGSIGAVFIEADDHHSAANLAKMNKGVPLDDADRSPWAEALRDKVAASAPDTVVVLACSALTPVVQSRLGETSRDVYWAHLQLDYDTLYQRLSSRTHFMPPELLDTQFAALDPPASARSFDARKSVVEIVQEIRTSFLV